MNKTEYSNAPLNGNLRHEPRSKAQALLNGARQKCPNCGEGAVFSSFLKVDDNCQNCGEELHHQRSDDAAPYFTILVLGHLIVPLLLILETHIFPPIWTYIIIGIPLVVAMTILTLPRVKGAVVGLQWALYMHGFDQDERAKPDPHIDPKEMIGQ